MKTGKAYAFFDYEQGETDLIRSLDKHRRRGNFSDSVKFNVLDDKLNDVYDHQRKGLPAKIAEVSEITEIYGNAPANMIGNLSKVEPKKATNLRYLVMAEYPEVSDSTSAGPLGQGRANRETAGMMHYVLGVISEENCFAGIRKFSRDVVFYQDGRGNVQRYP